MVRVLRLRDLSAEAGCFILTELSLGKSVLAARIIEKCRHSSTITTAYYFCRSQEGSTDEAGDILRCLALQLIRADENLVVHVSENYVRQRVSSSADQI